MKAQEKRTIKAKTIAKKLNNILTELSIDTEKRAGIILSLYYYFVTTEAKNKQNQDLNNIEISDAIKFWESLEYDESFKFLSAQDFQLMKTKAKLSLNMIKDSKVQISGKHLQANVDIGKQMFALFASVNNNKSEQEDFIDKIYEATQRYSVGRSKAMSVVLTPQSIKTIMQELGDVKEADKVIDGCAGTGALSQGLDGEVLNVEYSKEMAFVLFVKIGLCRDTKKQKLIIGDFFDKDIQKQIETFAPDGAILNPPFHFIHQGLGFASSCLDRMKEGGKLTIVTTTSSGAMNDSFFADVLKKHTLESVVAINDKSFIGASVKCQIYTFKAKVPHDDKVIVNYLDFRNDNVKRTKIGEDLTDEFYDSLKDVKSKARKLQIDEKAKSSLPPHVALIKGEVNRTITKKELFDFEEQKEQVKKRAQAAKDGSNKNKHQDDTIDLLDLVSGKGTKDELELKEFSIDELFDFDVKKIKGVKKSEEIDVRIISATTKNNGCLKTEKRKEYFSGSDLFTINVFGFVYYQGLEIFVASNSCYPIRLKTEKFASNESEDFFFLLAFVLSQQLSQRFDYFMAFGKNKKQFTKVLLPIDSEGLITLR